MTYDEIVEQLEITKSKIKEIARNEYGGESWNDDLDALTEAADIVADYSKATAQVSEMSQKYEQPAMAIRRRTGRLYTCPLCGKRIPVGHTHCHWCGKKVSWDREAYAGRERYPKYKQAYIRAFDKMLEVRETKGLKKMRGWENGKSVFRWWIDEKWNPDQMEIKDWLYEIGAITAEQYDDEHFIY